MTFHFLFIACIVDQLQYNFYQIVANNILIFMSINISKGTSTGTLSTNSPTTINYSLQADKYFISDLVLGEGGFGCVYRGKNLKNGADLAIKISDNLQLAAIEDRISLKIQGGAHSLKYYGSFFTEQRKPALVYEQFGVSLKEFMKNSENVITFPTIIQLFKLVVECVIDLKNLEVIHRDLKTQNILIKRESQRENKFEVKLCDLGLASEIDQNCTKIALAKLGTIYYKSPETVHFGENTFKSEVWSLGIILYEILYKKFPFDRQLYRNQQNLYHKLLLSPITFEGTPDIIREIGEACLNPNPEKRISLEQLSSKLNKLSNELGHPQSTLSTNKKSMSQERSSETIFYSLSDLFQELNDRLVSLKGLTSIEKKMIAMCKQVVKSKICSTYHFLEVANRNLLIQYIRKMKIMAKFTRSQKHIRFNIKEFMAIDTTLLLLKLIKNIQENELQEMQRSMDQYFKDNKNEQNIFLRCCKVFDELADFSN